MTWLNGIGWLDHWAANGILNHAEQHAINDEGQIVGVGTHNGSHFRAFLLTPLH